MHFNTTAALKSPSALEGALAPQKWEKITHAHQEGL